MMKRSPDENDNSCKTVKLPLAMTKTTPAKEIAIPAGYCCSRSNSSLASVCVPMTNLFDQAISCDDGV